MIAKFTRAYIRTYSDSGQTKAYIDWIDGRGREGRTEDRVCSREGDTALQPASPHMRSLFAAAVRQGLPIEFETW